MPNQTDGLMFRRFLTRPPEHLFDADAFRQKVDDTVSYYVSSMNESIRIEEESDAMNLNLHAHFTYRAASFEKASLEINNMIEKVPAGATRQEALKIISAPIAEYIEIATAYLEHLRDTLPSEDIAIKGAAATVSGYYFMFNTFFSTVGLKP